MNSVKFCWLCGNKLWGNHSEELIVDSHPRILHKTCSKAIKKEYDFKKINNEYHSMMWTTGDD